jgi:hypothetical protein
MMLADLKEGDMVTIHDHNGRLVRTAKVSEIMKKTVRTGHGNPLFSILTGKRIGGTTEFARPATAEQIAAAKQELAAREQQRLARLDAEQKAAYDALPEAVKLARTLGWLFDCNRDEKWETAPVEAMRALIQWAEANKLEGV